MQSFIQSILILMCIILILSVLYILYHPKPKNGKSSRKHVLYTYQKIKPSRHVERFPRNQKEKTDETQLLPLARVKYYSKQGVVIKDLIFNKDAEFIIGSGEHCDLQINNSYVSKEHAVIYIDSDSHKVMLADLQSLNGVFLYPDMSAIELLELQDGVQFFLAGTLRIMYEVIDPFIDIADLYQNDDVAKEASQNVTSNSTNTIIY